MSEDPNEDIHSKLERFAAWMIDKEIGAFLAQHPIPVVVFFLVFIQALYWATAWWSPWPFLIFSLSGFVFSTVVGGSPFAFYTANFRLALTTPLGARLIVIGVPFLLVQVAAGFACLYMLGTVVDSNGNPISGTWQHFYFSVVTLTTLGYGNLVPDGAWTEFVAVAEALVGFMAFAIYAGALANIVLSRAVPASERPESQHITFLTAEDVESIRMDQELGWSYYLRFVYATIYGSQYSLLSRLEGAGSIHIRTAEREYYSIHMSSYEEPARAHPFEDWVRYLLDNRLVLFDQPTGMIALTDAGSRFLSELDRSGLPRTFPT